MFEVIKMKINEHVNNVIETMSLHYGLNGRFLNECKTQLSFIVSLFDEDEWDSFDIDEYLEIIKTNKQHISISRVYLFRRLLSLLKKSINNEDITEWNYEKNTYKFNVGNDYLLMIKQYESFLLFDLKHSTVRHHSYQARKFLYYLESIKDVSVYEINQQDIYDYFYYIKIDCNFSLDNVIYSIKKFIIFLREYNYNSNLNELLLEKPAPSIKRNYSIFSLEELNKILSCIDRTTEIGKRDYSILSIAVTTALRSVDIATLKLKDIDWENKQIILSQNKTGNLNILPLSKETGDALADYILNGRPKTSSEYIFIRTKKPYKEINKKGTIQNIFLKYRKQANIDHQLNDGKTMHGIRRSVASQLVNNNININTVAQILGHSGLSTIKLYAKVDTKKLEVCSLELNDYPVSGGIYYEI